MTDDDECDNDLPLLSNSRDIHVHHYVLDLTCVFKEKRFKGSITLFCESRIPHEQSEKLMTTIIKEQNDEKSGDDTDAASPQTLQARSSQKSIIDLMENVLDQESIDKNLTSNSQTERASELAASAVVDSFLLQQSTSRLFSVKQLHLYNTNDCHISCSPCEMPPFCDKESVILPADTENKHLSSLVDHCYNSLEETQLHPNLSAEITDLFLFPNSDSGLKIEFNSCQNSGTHISDCAEGPNEVQGTQITSKPEVQLYAFKNLPIQTQIFCHDQTADASNTGHVPCNAGIETCSGIETSGEIAVCYNTEDLSSSEAQECYNSGTDTSESQSNHNFDAVHLAEVQVCDIKYVDKSNTTLASHELISGPSSATVSFVSNYSRTHPVTKTEILGISNTHPVTKVEILEIPSADAANQEHTYTCQKLEKQSPVCKTIMFTNNKNSHTASVDSLISNLMSHNSNFEILGKLELVPDKSVNSHVTIDITDLHSAPKSEDFKASCTKQSKFESESTLKINSSHSTDFHLILDSWNIIVDYVEEMVVYDSTSPMSQTHDELLQNHNELVQSCDLVAQECGELVHWSSFICKGNNVHVLRRDDFVHVNDKLVQKNYDDFVRFKDPLSQAKNETVGRNKEGFVGNEKLVKRNDESLQLAKGEFSQPNNIIFRESNKHVKEGEKLDGGSDEQVKQNKRREISMIAVRKRLVHETSKNCIRICKPGVQHAQDFPRIIRIHFTTDPQGSSLKWTQDQDGNECVYTHGHWINNRSLFPSQDVPDTMATWEACIHVEPQYTVLMSGDKEPIVTTSRCGLKSYYYHTEMEMPSSTLALAVGKWKEIKLLTDEDIRMSDIETAKFYLPCRIFSPSSLQKAAQAVLGRYIPSCMEASADFLGPHPFKRLDILIVPYSFNSLGMASPSLMFLSQSVLSADLMMCVRVAHEMSHSWFGLLIGPQDWTEEWLSEGFCTYTEEYIHCHIMKWNEEERYNHLGIRDYLKYRVLKAELHNTDEMFHILRPNKGQEIMLDGSTVQFVKNGMNPEKRYMQVHYLKGYFLLKHLEELVGIEDFHEFLLKFVQHFNGQLITSKDVLDLFFSSFSYHRLQGVCTESITQEWLDNPSIPKITCCELQEDNELAQHVLAQVKAFKEFGSEYKTLHWTKRRKKNPEDILSKLDGDQLVLFLEELLKEEHIHHHLLSSLRSYYSLHASNADVMHRWCELVIKHKLQTNYQDVFWFLVNHQAMGVYLFGELVISEDSHQKKLAEACFRKIASDMDTDVRITVHSMLYGT
ncbi:hypothetical protein CHS0354_029185 [Potamilus streckersoni]|uniref:Peptidase M1 leukotriene A4 hydrolase/aminopeptidase C-terminal domain-containing protein n=1 Tax=Potamilus streckersoni TaxID=2493646 RepID=A0AAE0TGW2_9BIVA|nr:hypothetical protein CHS0354_029185 [Potamilus streckersoni]